MIWFTSDEHYGHNNVRTGWEGTKGTVSPRPFASLEEMTEGLIERHNERVRPGDLVYHLGDMFWRTFTVEGALKVMGRLHGQHYYINGNHEELTKKYPALRAKFVWVRDREWIRPVGGPPAGIVLDHFAGRVWNRSHQGSWQLYGHSHGNLPDGRSSFDVGVDVWDYAPVSLDEVAAKMATLGG